MTYAFNHLLGRGSGKNALRAYTTPKGDVFSKFTFKLFYIHAFGLQRFEDVDSYLDQIP